VKLREPAVTEAEFQRTVTEFAQLAGWRVMHHRPTPAGAHRPRWTTATTVPGWPDLTLFAPGRGVLYRELKTDAGRLSIDQRQVLAELAAAGADVAVWRPSDWSEIERTLRPTRATTTETA